MASEATAGIEERVNTYTIGDQSDSTVTALADGGWLVSWRSNGQDGDGYGVYQQRYDSHGAAIGDETLVNTYTTGYQHQSTVTALADGGWLVSWTSFGQDGDSLGIYQRRYDSQGDAIGTETLVNTFTTDVQYIPKVTTLAGGGWVVSWTSLTQDGSGYGIYQQRYDSDGNTAGTETRVNTYTNGDQRDPTVTALADGGWLVSWASSGQDGDGSGIYQQRYDSHGATVGGESRVNAYITGDQYNPMVTTLADGGWVVSWVSYGQDGSASGIYQQRYDSDGSAASDEIRVNTYTLGFQLDSTVTALADGGWLVTWGSQGQDGDGYGIYQQRYDSHGVTVGGEFRVNDHTAGDQYVPTVAAMADGGWVVSWTSDAQDGDSLGVYQRHFAADVRGSALADQLIGTSWDESLIGFAGNDRLDGKGGNDILIGGFGNDTYVVNSAGDQVQELVNQGTDTVLATVTFSLEQSIGVENLTLTGKKNIDATGNGIGNVLIGNGGDNALSGLGGKDVLDGGKGDDTLSGGALSDRFVFKSGYGNDTISDFDATTSAHDQLDLSGVKGIATFAALQPHMAQHGSAVVIDFGHGDTITLEHVKLNTLDAGDFLF
jgi:Ca2+-binding RTX toxin-like protein